MLAQMVEGIDQKELNKIAERFIEEIDISDVSFDNLNILDNDLNDQDDLISLEEFLKVMDKCDAENKMSMKFRG